MAPFFFQCDFQQLYEEAEQARLDDIERKVLEGQLSREEAILARQRLQAENAEQAKAVKAERQQLEAM